ncbi:MAG: sulfurtransferase complex subunit TusD [Porticoccaceae bacterium]|nr:sulfurtransferase complex subunit TusD [Porticoccaceae bacterium]
MKFTIVILGAPYTDEAAESAFRFTQAALEKNHQIYRLFFYHDGVHNASSLITLPQDEIQPAQRWANLIAQYDLEAIVCIASSLRRGLLNETEAKRFSKPASNLTPGFKLAGLGDLVDAAQQSDRLITFGPTS